MTSMVAGRMAEAAATLIESLDQAQRRIACRPFPDEDGAPPVVLHADRSWRPAARRHGRDPASKRPSAGRDRPVHARLRDRRRDHGARQHPGSARRLVGRLRPRARSRPAALLHHDLRRAGRRRSLGLALRRAPCLAALHDHRRRGRGVDPELSRRRSGRQPAARPASAPSARRRGGSRPRAVQVAGRGKARAGAGRAGGAHGSGRLQPPAPSHRRPDAADPRHLSPAVRGPARRARGRHADPDWRRRSACRRLTSMP